MLNIANPAALSLSQPPPALNSIPDGDKWRFQRRSSWRSRRHAAFGKREEAKQQLVGSLRAAGELQLAERIEGCASRARVVGCARHGASGSAHNRCGVEKLCPHCQEHRRRKCLRWMPRLLEGRGSLIFLTLTLPSNHDLGHCCRRLAVAFKKLRGRAAWKRHVRGGVYFVHLTHNPQEGFHLHVHVVFFGYFWRQEEISTLWTGCGGGEVVHIKPVWDLKRLLKYLLRPDLSFADDPEAIAICCRVMHGKRLYSTFGELYGKVTPLKQRLRRERKCQPSAICGVCGGRTEVLRDLLPGSRVSRMVHCLPRPPTLSLGFPRHKI